MKLEKTKQIIDDYFNSVTSEEVFERLSYQVTRSNYYYIKNRKVLPKDLCFYTYVGKDKVIKCLESIILDFDDKFDDENIQKMIEVEKETEGFMFWNASKTGNQWFKDNWHSALKLF